MLIVSQMPLSKLLNAKGVDSFEKALSHLRVIPYGRASNRTDLSLVMKENVGSCSSKHAFLKQLAIENDWVSVKLYLGIYKMNKQNTPGIGDVLSNYAIDSIPEAHCYLKIQGKVIDITSSTSSFERIRADVLEEIEIEPYQVSEFKIEYHQNFLKKWLQTNQVNLTFKTIWNLREECIKNLSQPKQEA